MMIAASAKPMGHVLIDVDEDPACGDTAKDKSLLPEVITRKVAKLPDRLTEDSDRSDVFVMGRFQVDSDGEFAGAEVFQSLPAGKRLGDVFEDQFRRWEFATGRPGSFCASVTVLIGPIQKDWGDIEYPVAPKPTLADSLAYPADAFATGKSGLVTLLVQITSAGTVGAARVMSEDPGGMGFAVSALEGVAAWRFDGATPGRYRLKVRFKPDPANAPP